MATLHVIVTDEKIKVLVNGFCEMERTTDTNDFYIVSSFLDSLVEMCVITHEQREEKIQRLKKVLDLD